MVGVLGVGAVAGLALLEVTIRRSDVGASLVLGLLLLRETGFVDMGVAAGPVRIQATDLVFVVLFAAAVARLLRMDRSTTTQRLLITIGLLTIWALVRGTGPFGIPAAVNEARQFLWFTGSALYFATVEPRRELLDRIGRLWLAAAVMLAVIALIRWVGNTAGLSGGFFGRDDDLRVLPAAMTLIISQAAMLSFPFIVDRTAGWRRYLAPGLLVLIVVLQHRTVWVVTAVGALLLCRRERAIARRAVTLLLSVIVLFTALAFALFDDAEIQLTDQLATSAQSTATFEWRLEGWRALLTDTGPEGVEEVVAGKPFGSGYERTLPNGRTVSGHISPHNYYVEAVLRVGVAGLLLLVLIYAIALRGTSAVSRSGSVGAGLLTPTVLHVMIAVQLVFYVTYAPDMSQAMLLGLGCAVASGDTAGARPVPHRTEVAA